MWGCSGWYSRSASMSNKKPRGMTHAHTSVPSLYLYLLFIILWVFIAYSSLPSNEDKERNIGIISLQYYHGNLRRPLEKGLSDSFFLHVKSHFARFYSQENVKFLCWKKVLRFQLDLFFDILTNKGFGTCGAIEYQINNMQAWNVLIDTNWILNIFLVRQKRRS